MKTDCDFARRYTDRSDEKTVNFNFCVENLRLHSARHHTDDTYISVYTSCCKLAHALWNEAGYSPDTGITGKLRDRGRFFITTGARDSLALLLGKFSMARYKECNLEILWVQTGAATMRWCVGVIRPNQ